MSNRNFHIIKPALTGAVIALGFLVFIFGFFGNPKPIDFQWMVWPLIIVPVGGAIGGIFYSFIDQLNFKNTRISILANFFSVLLYLFLLVIAFAWVRDLPQ